MELKGACITCQLFKSILLKFYYHELHMFHKTQDLFCKLEIEPLILYIWTFLWNYVLYLNECVTARLKKASKMWINILSRKIVKMWEDTYCEADYCVCC